MLIYKFKKKNEELFINYIRYRLGFSNTLIIIESIENIFLLVNAFFSTDYFKYRRKNRKRGRAKLENVVLKENKIRYTLGNYSDIGNTCLEHRYYLREDDINEVTVMFSSNIEIREIDLVFDIIARLPEL